MISLDSIVQRKQLLFDIGSSYTRVSVGNSLVFFEPSCIAIHAKTDAVLAIGSKAAALLGKTPENIQVIFPIRAGVVASEQYAVRFIDAIIQEHIQADVVTSLVGFTGIASVPSKLSPVNSYMWQRVFQKAGVTSISLVEHARSSYAYIAGPKALTHSVCIVDVGGQKTDIAVISASEIVSAHTFEGGGVDCTEIVQDLLLEKEKIIIGWQTAEQCKKDVVSLPIKKQKDKKVVIRGKDAYHHVAKTLPVQTNLFEKEVQLYAQKTLQEIQQFFSTVAPELAASTLERGIYLAGGGAQLIGLQEYLQASLKTEITVLAQPQLAAINGLMRLQKK